ncbi:ABC transporter substrate-binding protein [Streptomyces sioyaensis]|uniref:ABC transporter substrate-binding protein n=1 Tax=Streptomyces sioyaensis TaxID=67364 RepID=A0A4Q1RCF6_9ACTN|nr:ABC transporter substrate-binding protein [Streptomyces sioyaensis]MBM4795831.1 ABC transporter substrate-binding protein [Streptomyces sioyaensis]RXS71488.1 ABC transporter substrate-binding protein [Streptomyces sioyaensis]
MSSRLPGSPSTPFPNTSPAGSAPAPSSAARRPAGRRILVAALSSTLLMSSLSGCGSTADASDDKTVTVTVGYQSKTINTVTAGTLLRSLGSFERALRAQGRRDGRTYKVRWQDYATGAPITAQMVAGKVDIGSMGDFPLLINAARGTQLHAPTRLVSVTGYNLRGALNTIVTRPGSPLRSLADLRGKNVSSSVGSASDGTLVRALQRAGIDPEQGIHKLNQQPAVGASALRSGSADALSQFVAWPGLLAFQGKAQALYDGGALGLPTFHGVTVRNAFAERHPALVRAFLTAQRDATRYLQAHPVDAAQKVASATGLPPEVVYLYNGSGGIATFDPTLKPQLLAALKKDVPVLRAAKLTGPVDVDSFVDDRYLRQSYGSGYAKAVRSTAHPSPDEVWLRGEDRTHTFAGPAALLRFVAAHHGTVRAAYTADTTTGSRWFADKSVWVHDGNRLLPFTARATADAWTHRHRGARTVSYAAALELAR